VRTQRVVEASWPTQRHTLMTVVEVAEAGQGDNLGVTNYADLPWAARGCGLREAEVGAIIMVVSPVVPEQAMQVAIVEDDHVVEELRRALPIQRSATPYRHGLLGAVGVGFVPRDFTIETTRAE
jgi:hypothetical protein